MMNAETADILLAINRLFYQKLGTSFSATRQRIQPGVRRVLSTLPPDKVVLDVGCGNGNVARQLTKQGHQGCYVGVDFSAELLADARQGVPAAFDGHFIQADLAAAGWAASLPVSMFDTILAFAVFHHLPGYDLRRRTMLDLRAHLLPEGSLVHSHWQFLNSPRLRERIQAWEAIDLKAEQVERGDYLLDWRHGGHGLRYVHHLDIPELQRLAAETGFTVGDTFYSDGEGGCLGLYQVWTPIK